MTAEFTILDLQSLAMERVLREDAELEHPFLCGCERCMWRYKQLVGGGEESWELKTSSERSIGRSEL